MLQKRHVPLSHYRKQGKIPRVGTAVPPRGRGRGESDAGMNIRCIPQTKVIYECKLQLAIGYYNGKTDTGRKVDLSKSQPFLSLSYVVIFFSLLNLQTKTRQFNCHFPHYSLGEGQFQNKDIC